MPSFSIAGLTVNMTPLYRQMVITAEKFKRNAVQDPQIIIPYTEDHYKNWLKIRPHLTLSDAENICASDFFAGEVILHDGIVLHASAVMFDGKGYLFSADSGIGKSTHTRLWQDYFGSDRAVIINDDKPAVRLIDGNIFACGTPWCGNSQTCENLTVPLAAVVFLNRNINNKIVPLKNAAEILPLLLSQTVHRTTADKMNRVLTFAEELIKAVPFYKLDCTMSLEAVKIASKAILK